MDYEKEEFEPVNHSRFDNQIVMISYLSTLVTTFIIPVILWVMKKDEDRETGEALADVLNFSISYTIYLFVSGILTVVLIGFITTPIIGLLMIIFSIIGAVKSYNGERYVAPLTIKFLK
ncbi:hypothetical protein GCM10007358_08110 [Phocicoccus schoeneichii]|uniref:Chloroplast import component protein (Tic20) n=1 Tax=Phocicoccus schoeneichii TaxID=1812261 RepID=A0A6V7R6V5_9BACL|nr:DUF4870 domain-containing protein [Jeotgalicoccus schoeneichii]GGH50866.1 hypothetical protein GCM10007358_08110 [Jeotgalicoccus schoeneichii]CAD2072784.1 hypothetical protein JEOSCH030_00422 [Jeotgalicoccus schoeneichii]